MNSPSPLSLTREIVIRRKVVENRTVAERGIRISWHPHHPIYPLRLWVSEWESTRMKRERILQLCLGLTDRQRLRDEYTRQQRAWAEGENRQLNHWKKDYSLQASKEMAILSRTSSVCETAAQRENGDEVDQKWQKRVKNRTLKNAESRFRGTRTFPIYPLSYGAGHSVRGTHSISYSYRGSVCVRVIEHQHRERTPSGVVFWTEPREIQQVQWDSVRE